MGCKDSRGKEIVGTWVSKQGMKIVVAEDRTYQTEGSPVKTVGTWQMDGAYFIFTPKTVNGKSMAEVKTRLQNYTTRAPAARRPLLEKIIHDVELPNVLSVSADGKTLTTDKARDRNESGWTTLTKESAG